MFIFVLRKQIHNSVFLSHFLNFLKSNLFCIEFFGCSFPFGNSKGFIYLNSLITYQGNLPLRIFPIIKHVICSGSMYILTSANIKFRILFFFQYLLQLSNHQFSIHLTKVVLQTESLQMVSVPCLCIIILFLCLGLTVYSSFYFDSLAPRGEQ